VKDVGKTSTHKKEIPVQTGGFRGVLAKRNRRILVAVIVLIVISLLGLWSYSLIRSLNPATQKAVVDVDQISDNYLSMTPEQIAYVLDQRTGLDVSRLQSESLTKGTLKNDFGHAYQAAQALRGLGDGQKSLEAYSVADTLVTTQDTSTLESFYLDYSHVALEYGKASDVERVAEKGKAAIDRSSLSPARKASSKKKFDDMIWLAKQ